MPNYSWNQPCCEKCWIEAYPILSDDGANLIGVSRLPVMVIGEARQLEQCSYCGDLTFVGIYQRDDPKTVAYPALKDDS